MRNWPNKASYNSKSIENWLTKGHNLGLVTGAQSGIVVIDVDPRNGGDESLEQLYSECGQLPDTVICNTGGGGKHFYFKYYDGAKSTRLQNGIDFQADRHCVVLPPSIHPETNASYEWETDPVQTILADLPRSWRDAMAGRGGVLNRDGQLPEGFRNNRLFELAIEMYKGGASESAVYFNLLEENNARCMPPLPQAEIKTIVASAMRYRPSGESLKTQYQNIVWRWNLKSNEKLFLQALASWADVNGRNCYPTQDQLAERTGLCLRTVKTLSARLEAAGWFERFRHPRPVGAGYNYSYRLTFPLSAKEVREVHHLGGRRCN